MTRFTAVDGAQEVRPEGQDMRRNAEARVLEARLERLERVLRVRHIRPRSGEVVEVEWDREAQARLAQKGFRFGRVVRVLGDVVRVSEEARGHELLRHRT